MIRLFKYLFMVVAVAFAACHVRNDELKTIDKALDLRVEVETITSTSVRVKVTHTSDTSSSWYGMLTDDTTTPALTLLDERLNEGVAIEDLHYEREYVATFEDLTPHRGYRYIAIGLTPEGRRYGNLQDVAFTIVDTLVENSAWTVMYRGAGDVEGESYDHVVEVFSKDDNYYTLAVLEVDKFDEATLMPYAEALREEMRAYLEGYNAENGTSHRFVDMLYLGSNREHFDLVPGSYRALAIGFEPSGSISGLYATSAVFEVKAQAPTTEYNAWLGQWSIEGENGVSTDVVITQRVANASFYMTGWEGFSNLNIELEYSAEDDSVLILSQCVAEDYDLGEKYGRADIYLFAGDREGYYDHSEGRYYIASGATLEDGSREIVGYQADMAHYPQFTQMFFMADIDGQFYALSAEDNIPTFGLTMYR